MNEDMRRRTAKVLFFVLLFTVLASAALAVGYLLQRQDSPSGRRADAVIDGVSYKEKDLTTYLIIGLDITGKQTDSGSYNNTQQADYLLLLSFDRIQKTYHALQLNRDSMVPVKELSVTGESLGKRTMQLALSHTYGNGLETSCKNVKQTVSDLIFGMSIDYYVCFTMGAVPLLNDAVGGVTLTMEKDYTEIDSAFTEGSEVTLSGEQAMHFVRARKYVEDSTNLSRMERQKQYAMAFLKQAEAYGQQKDFTDTLYGDLSEYLLTDASLNVLQSMASDISGYTFTGIDIPVGQLSLKGEFAEFYLDEAAWKTLAIDLYYEKVQN